MKFGIIREGKSPPDARVPLTPGQCRRLREDQGLELVVQPSNGRSFPNDEYAALDVPLQHSLADCDVLLGVKEVPIEELIPEKTYCFFSHTIKAQPYNRSLLQAILRQGIRLIDYEVLTDERGVRLIAFGRFAGMVGAHNALWTFGRRTGSFVLPRMKDCRDYAEARQFYRDVAWPPLRIVLTGTGRVGNGAAEVLEDMGIQRVEPAAFLSRDFPYPVFTQLAVEDYVHPPEGTSFSLAAYFADPTGYTSSFDPYTRHADIMINGIYWDKRAPAFFTREAMRKADWTIQVIADITCDIAPESSIPSTLRASTIEDPVYGFDKGTASETEPYQEDVVDIMAVDNLPNELPRDASQAFGEQFIEHILPEFFKERSPMLERATIAQDGRLGPHFQYLDSYVKG